MGRKRRIPWETTGHCAAPAFQTRQEAKTSPRFSITLAFESLAEVFFQVLTILIPVIALSVVFRNLNWQHLPIL